MSKIQHIQPLTDPVDADVVIPGSKSITNRALVAAILADGVSELSGVLDADDTQAMLGVARSLGAGVEQDPDRPDVYQITGTAAKLKPGPVDIHVAMSGTTARFATPLAARGRGRYRIDADIQMCSRPMDITVKALRELGVNIYPETAGPTSAAETVGAAAPTLSLPLIIEADGISGGKVAIDASASSQFASGLMLSAPGIEKPLEVELVGDIVSLPYLDMTVAVMESFHARVERSETNIYKVATDAYKASDYRIEPDASAASYFLALAAVAGGRIRIDGLGTQALQGDIGFAHVLESMGAKITMGSTFTEVVSDGQLRGAEVDMSNISDTAQTLAAIAPFANSPTRVTGIGFIRAKETDRIAAVVTELNRLGIDATDDGDGFTIHPGTPKPGVVQTYRDHRMAMSFSLLALKSRGVSIADPDCVAKTFPTYWQVLETALKG